MNAVEKLAVKYFANIKEYVECKGADERLMRAIENQIDIPEQGADDFRRHILCQIGVAFLDGRVVQWDIEERLAKAFRLEASDRLMQIDQDDQVFQIMDKVNKVLKPYGLQFEHDENDESEYTTAFYLI